MGSWRLVIYNERLKPTNDCHRVQVLLWKFDLMRPKYSSAASFLGREGLPPRTTVGLCHMCDFSTKRLVLLFTLGLLLVCSMYSTRYRSAEISDFEDLHESWENIRCVTKSGSVG